MAGDNDIKKILLTMKQGIVVFEFSFHKIILLFTDKYIEDIC